MRKTLIAVLVFGMVLLVASPSQAVPVDLRASNAAICIDDFYTAANAESLDRMERLLMRLEGACRSAARSFTLGLGSKTKASPAALGEAFVNKVLRKYRVTSSQVRRWQDKLGFSYD